MTRWDASLDPASYEAVIQKSATTKPQLGPNVDALTLNNLKRVKQRAGWLDPATQMALARSNASDAVVDAAGRLKAKQIVDTQAQPAGSFPSKIRKEIYDNIKTVSRWGTAVLNFIPEYAQGAVGQLFDDNDDVEGWFISTTLGSMIENPELRGEGFFASEELMKKQAERARRYRGRLNVTDTNPEGSAFTIGRGAASLIFQPNTKPYNIMSGFLDAATLVGTDPTGPITKTVKVINKGRYMVPLLSKVDISAERLALEAEAGISHGLLGATVNGKKLNNFLQNNSRAVALVNRLRDEDSVLRIAEDIFDGQISNDVALRLAAAKTDDEIRGILAEGWVMGGDTLSRDIRTYQAGKIKSGLGEIVEKIPLADSIRKSRWFTTMPDNLIVVNGTDDDNRKAVSNMIRAMRTTGVSNEDVERLAPDLYAAFSSAGGATAKATALDTFNTVLKVQLRANGVPQDVVERMIDGAKADIDLIRRYMIDRSGNVTDNGMYRHLTNANYDYLPIEELEAMISHFGGSEGMKLAGPLQISELLNRVHVLPNIRELRRATANPFFNKTLKGLSLTAKRTKRTFTELPQENVGRHKQITDELATLATQYPKGTRMPEEVAQKLMALTNERNSLYRTVTRKVNIGEQRAALEAVDFIQNTLWKPLALATGGYILRNSIDAQVRLAFGGLSSAVTHPWEYMMLLLGQSKRRDILGREILGYEALDDIGRRLISGEKLEDVVGATADEFQEQLRKDLGFGIRQAGFDSPEGADHLKSTNVWDDHTRTDPDGINLHTDGVAQTGGLIYGDPLQRLAAEGLVSGQSRGQVIARIVARIKADKDLLRDVEAVYTGNPKGLPVVNKDGKKGYLPLPKAFKDMRREELDIFLNQHVDRIVLQNVELQSGGMGDLQFMQAFNYVPKTVGRLTPEDSFMLQQQADQLIDIINRTAAELPTANSASRLELEDAITRYQNELARIRAQLASNNKRVPARIITVDELIETDSIITPGNVRIGTVVKLSDEEIGVVTQLENAPERLQFDGFTGEYVDIPGGEAVVVTPVHGERAFVRSGRRTGSIEARRLIGQMPIYSDETKTGLPNAVKREILQEEAEDRFLNHSRKAMDKFTNMFFGSIYGSTTRVLDRSPAFREFYYEAILENADMLSPEEAQKVLDNLGKRAAAQNMEIEDFIKNDDVVKALKASTLTEGSATGVDLDEYARVTAINKTKDLLFDASNRNNLEDALRVIMPFAPAWREVLGTYIGFAKGNPVGTARSFQRIYSGAIGADYDNDGRGLFYNDPITGQLVFTFPASGTLAKIFTGVEAPLEAPIKRLSQGIQAYPSLGPFMQVAASQLPDSPKFDEIRDFLLPYGEKGVGSAFNPTPQWVDKFLQAAKADTGKLDNVFGNTYIETLRALGASGDYNLDDPNDIQRIKEDGRRKARILTLLRAASQFFGPTAGTTEFKISTKEGDIFVSSLVKEFYDLQAKNYDTAVPEFLRKYGDEVELYMSSKTRSLVQGLEATEEFGAWERENAELFDTYPDVAAYLAPAGSEFNFSVWDRQIRTGKRERLSDEQVIELAQRRIGAAKYADARRMMGPYPSALQKDVLRKYRTYLHEQYPGFPLYAEFTVGEFQNNVEQLRNLVNDDRVAGNVTAGTIRQYLTYRDQAIGAYVASGGKPTGFQNAKSAIGLRDALASIGATLSERDSNFARVYERLLAQEVED